MHPINTIMQRKKTVNNPFKTEDFAVGSKGSNVSKKRKKVLFT